MAGNQKEVELALRVSTLGEDGIRRLEDDLRNLAQQGGAAAPAFERLADEVQRLGTTAKQLDQFAQVSREVAELSDAQNVAAETAHVLYAELLNLKAGTENFAQAENDAKSALKQAQADLTATQDAMRLLRIETDAAGKNTDAYRSQLTDLRRTQLEQEQTIRSLRDAYQAAKQATKDAADQESEMSTRLAAANREAAASAATLRDRNEALREARGDLAAAGLATDDLTVAQGKLLAALNAAGAAAAEERAQTQRAAAEWQAQAEEEQRLSDIMLRTRNQLADAARAEAEGVARDYERMQQAQAAAAQAAQTISDAFKTVGTRSVQELEAEIVNVRAAMQTLQTSATMSGAELDRAMSQGKAKIADLELSIRKATDSMTFMDRVSGALKTTIGQLATGFGIVTTVQRLASGFLEATKQGQALNLGLTTLYKSSEVAAEQIDFLRAVADRAGVSVGDISQEFVKFSASMKASNIPLEQSNALFAAVTQAAGTLGLSGEKVSEILAALGQMAAKGTVSMEELRQQLGDSLPGALALTAKGLGLTEQQLVKLVESGGLMSRDLFPALTRSLQEMTGEVNTLNSAWERFKNLGTTTAQVMGDSGWIDVLKGALMELGAVLGPIGLGISVIFETIFTTVRAIGTTLSALINGDLSSLGDALKQQLDDAIARQTKLAEAYQRMIGMSDDAGASHQRTAAAAQRAGQAAQGAAGQVASHTSALQSNAGAAGAAATAQTTVASATERAAAQAKIAGANIVQLGVAYAQSSAQLAAATDVAERLVKAQQIEANSMADIVKMRGSERASLDQSVHSAEAMLAANERLLAARQGEADALRTYIVQLQEEIRLNGDPDGARAKDLQAREQKLRQLEAEAQRTKETVEADKTKVESARLTRQSYEDNSAALDDLRRAMDTAKQSQQEMEVLEINGKATRDQVTEATRRAAEAEGLYRDALKDTAAAAERAVQQIQNRNIIAQASLSLDAERARSMQALAKATGDTTLATQAAIDGIEVEIKSRLANANSIAAEVQQRLAEIDAVRAAQQALGSWNVEKEAEYQKTKAGLEAKKLESDALKESTESLKRQADQLRESASGQDNLRTSTDGTTEAVKRQTAALEELYNRNKINRDQSLTNDGLKNNGDGGAAGGTFNNTLPIDLATRLKETGGKGMTDAEIAQAIQQAHNAYKDMQAFSTQDPGAASTDYINSVTALENAANVAQQKLSGGSMTRRGVAAGGTTGQGAAGGTSGNANTASNTRTVNIQIGGTTTPINVASQQDSDNLVSLLRQLESASTRTTQ